jgi:hypothetical protein
MKLKIGLIIALFVINLSVFAQERKGKGGGENIADFKDELGLNDEQLEKIKAINTEYFPKIREARKAEPQDKEAVKTLVRERKSKIEQVLTPEQVGKWREILEKKRSERQNPELKRALRDYREKTIKPVMIEKRTRLEDQLSAEEKESIAEIRAKMQAVKKSMQQADKENTDKSKLRKRGKEIRQEAFQSLKPILDNHRDIIETIIKEVEPQQKIWKQDMDSIKASYGIKPKKTKTNENHLKKKQDKMILKFILMEPMG